MAASPSASAGAACSNFRRTGMLNAKPFWRTFKKRHKLLTTGPASPSSSDRKR
jgi:hypothetical protein